MPHDLTPADLAGPMDATERPEHVRLFTASQVAHAEQAARQDERRKVLEALARIYLCDGCSLPVAEVCDEYLDRSGALLGEVRDCARALAEEVT